MEGVNWLSIVICTLIPTIVGFIYYNPKVFGKAWMDSLGMTEEQLRPNNMAVMMIISLVLSLFLTFFLLGFNNGEGQEGEFDNFGHGAFHGAFLAIMVALPVLITNGMYEKKSWKNALINAVYWVITITLMGGVIDAMNTISMTGTQ